MVDIDLYDKKTKETKKNHNQFKFDRPIFEIRFFQYVCDYANWQLKKASLDHSNYPEILYRTV